MSVQRTAIVTGASRGIGRAIAVALGKSGFNVVVNYASNVAAADECVKLVAEAGGRAWPVQADISVADDRERLLRTALDAYGRIDLLVNNAGVAPNVRADLLEMSEASFDRLIANNLRGPFFLTQRVAPEMLRSRGEYPAEVLPAIVNVSSISAYTASVNRGEYCIAKAGVAMMTQLFAARLAADGINVYEIRPGIIETDMTSNEAVKAKYDRLIHEGDLLPIPRWGTPDDIGKAVAAIAAGSFPYSTGQVFDVDGGFHLRRL
jgi:NAD(P)-dependent dehydrogenase (short-subunit alcohol dehydrogenase family)